MRDYDEAWLLPSWDNPDFNAADWRKEAEEAFQRQAAADRFFKGLRTGTVSLNEADAFFGQLAEDEIDPDEFVDAVIDNMKVIVDEGAPVNTDGLGLSRQIITGS